MDGNGHIGLGMWMCNSGASFLCVRPMPLIVRLFKPAIPVNRNIKSAVFYTPPAFSLHVIYYTLVYSVLQRAVKQ
jgi:hypothetical protein